MTPPRTPSAEEIARKLTAAGHDALLMAARNGYCSRRSRMHDRMRNSLPKGLAVARPTDNKDVANWQLTGLGVEVAALLAQPEREEPLR